MPTRPNAATRSSTPTTTAPSFVRASDQPTSETTLEAIRDKLREALEEEAFIKDLETQLNDAKARLNNLYMKSLPDMMQAANVDIVGLPPPPGANDRPTFDAKLKPFYSANIAASWPDDKRTKGFAFLKREKADDLIKNTITIKLGKGTAKTAAAIAAFLKKKRVEFTQKQEVHNQTLTAWLKEQYEDHEKSYPLSELEMIGASVGKIVNLKPRT